MDSPRSSLALLSPSTQRTASMMLDLPQPLGPTTPTSCPGSRKLVGSANDLKPESLMELSRTNRSLAQTPAGGREQAGSAPESWRCASPPTRPQYYPSDQGLTEPMHHL